MHAGQIRTLLQSKDFFPYVYVQENMVQDKGADVILTWLEQLSIKLVESVLTENKSGIWTSHLHCLTLTVWYSKTW